MSLLPADPSFRWTKYGAFVITGTLSLSHFLAWTLIPSNTAGRTKRTLTSSWTFVCYCVGNMCGSQIFRSEDAPRYVKGIVACAFCFAIQFAVIACWRIVLVVRNRKRRGNWAVEGLSEEERERRGRVLGQKDVTDFENPYVGNPVSISILHSHRSYRVSYVAEIYFILTVLQFLYSL